MKINGYQWKSMQNQWKSMKINENLWKSMKTYENQWDWRSLLVYGAVMRGRRESCEVGEGAGHAPQALQRPQGPPGQRGMTQSPPTWP